MEQLWAGTTRANTYDPLRWIKWLFLAGVLLPWLSGAVAWRMLGKALDTGNHSVPGVMVFAAVWNYVLACLIPPVALMLVARTRTGPITWYRLHDDERRLFAKVMFVTFCVLALVLFALVWQQNNFTMIPVMMTSFLPALVASLAGVLAATATVAGRNAVRRPRKADTPSYSRRHPV